MKIVVLIPIYKTVPSSYEVISIDQCFKILHRHAILFVHPENLDLTYYRERYQKQSSFISFPDKYFKNIKSYSRLMLSTDFYSNFTSFEYMLVYQPDSYIFKDNLEYWCSKNYDYIGGVWFEDFDDNTLLERKMTFPGNGGFSLRKISSILQVLSSTEPFESSDILLQKINYQFNQLRPLKDFILQIAKLTLRLLGWMNSPKTKARYWKYNEDSYFVRMATRYNRLHIPPIEEAVYFAWDTHPAYLFSKYKELPMGAHAWCKQHTFYTGNLEFWKRYILP